MIKKIMKRLLLLKNYRSNDTYISYLQNNGAKIGGGTYFYDYRNDPVVTVHS